MRSQTGIKKVHPKELTKPVGFDLETERRGIERSTELEEEHYEFKANPVPTAILQGVTVRHHMEAWDLFQYKDFLFGYRIPIITGMKVFRIFPDFRTF